MAKPVTVMKGDFGRMKRCVYVAFPAANTKFAKCTAATLTAERTFPEPGVGSGSVVSPTSWSEGVWVVVSLETEGDEEGAVDVVAAMVDVEVGVSVEEVVVVVAGGV